jgi:excisionase family DNA binding protein
MDTQDADTGGNSGQRWLTVPEIASMLHLNVRTVQRAILRGELRGVKFPSPAGWRILERDYHAWLESRQSKARDAGEMKPTE